MIKNRVIKSKDLFRISWQTIGIQAPVAFLLLLLLHSCGGRDVKTETIVKHKIERQEMVNILTDLAIVESILVEEKQGKKDLRILSYEYYHEVLKTHKVTKSDFEETLEDYMNDYDNSEQFLTDVITELNRRKESLDDK